MSLTIGSSAVSSSNYLASLLSKLDTNNDGKINKAEFVAGASSENSTQAATLFDKLDTSGTGALTASDLASSFQKLASQTQAALIQAQSVGSSNAKDLFTKLDTNGDSKVSRDEFIAGRPDNVSEDQAGALYDKIAKKAGVSSSDGLTQSQLTAGLPKPGGNHHADGGQGPNAAELFTKLDTNNDGKVTRDEFIAGRPDNVSEADAGTFYDKIASSSGSTSTDGLTKDQLSAGLEANAPAGGPPPAGGGASASAAGGDTDSDNDGIPDSIDSTPYGDTSASASSSTSTADLLKKLEDALKSDSSGTTNGLLKQFLSAIDHYKKTASATGANDSLNQSLLSIAA